MKFVAKASKLGRSGTFTDLPLIWRNVSINTPVCLNYTCAGSVPHLTYDVLKHLDLNSNGLGWTLQPLPTIVEFKDAVLNMGKGLGPYVGLEEYPFHVSMQDPAVVTPSGYNGKNGASVWSYSGKKMLTSETFMSIIKSFHPLSYQVLCDSDTTANATNKRLNKSITNTLNFLDQCLDYHKSCDELKNTFVFGTIQGGYSSDLRKQSATETIRRPVDGFVIDGFHTNGPEVMKLSFDEIKPLLLDVIKLLPEEKPRMFNGPLKPSIILEAVRCGIDIFDSSYPYLLTESGEALNLPIFDKKATNDVIIPPVKKEKQAFELDLKEKSYADKFVSISEDCECYCCKNFTCAYVHHLLNTSELLGSVLLMLHNMFQFAKFFAALREAIKNDTFEELEAYFKS